MREIKFRAWNKKKNKMTKHFGYGKTYMSGGDGISINELIKAEQAYNMIIMQYIGLKDKNGKEIYEGDVVKWSYSQDEASSFIAKVIWIDFVDKGDLDTDQRHIGFMLEFSDKGITDFPIKHELEIIGNVYENPELKETL